MLVREYNRAYGKNQPIILFHPKQQHLGKNLLTTIQKHLVVDKTSDTATFPSLKYDINSWTIQNKHLSAQPLQDLQQNEYFLQKPRHTLDFFYQPKKKQKKNGRGLNMGLFQVASTYYQI